MGRSNGRALTVHSGAPLGLLLPVLIQLISGLPPEGPSLTLVQGGSALGPQNSHGPEGQGIGAAGGHSGCRLGVLGTQSGASLADCGEPCSLGWAEDWETGWAAPKGQGCACGSPSPGDHPPRGREQGLQNGLLLGGKDPSGQRLAQCPHSGSWLASWAFSALAVGQMLTCDPCSIPGRLPPTLLAPHIPVLLLPSSWLSGTSSWAFSSPGAVWSPSQTWAFHCPLSGLPCLPPPTVGPRSQGQDLASASLLPRPAPSLDPADTSATCSFLSSGFGSVGPYLKFHFSALSSMLFN